MSKPSYQELIQQRNDWVKKVEDRDKTIKEMNEVVRSLSDRVAQQSDILSTRAEKQDIYRKPISQHNGSKYVRTIREVGGGPGTLQVDVYCVIDAFGITDAPLQHAAKKILCCGVRGKGDRLEDIKGILEAVWRAYDMELQRLGEQPVE